MLRGIPADLLRPAPLALLYSRWDEAWDVRQSSLECNQRDRVDKRRPHRLARDDRILHTNDYCEALSMQKQAHACGLNAPNPEGWLSTDEGTDEDGMHARYP